MALTHRALWLIPLGVVAAVIWPSPGTVRIWAVASVAVLALDAWLAPRPDDLRVARAPIPARRLGESGESLLTVTNSGGRRVRGLLRDAWQPSAGAVGDRHEVDLVPRERVRIATRLQPTRRGDRIADAVTIRLRGPLGLAARQRSFVVPGTLRALHPFASRKHLPSKLAQLREIDGRSAVRTRGQGTEFDSLRDYVEGDDVRSIDWRATARRQHLVVRTWQPEQHRRIVIVLDSSRTSAGRVGDAPRLDAGMDAALLLAALAQHARDRVEVVVGDRRIRARVGGGTRGTASLKDIVEAFAGVEPELVEADWPALLSAVSARGNRRALVVLVTPLESAAVEFGLLPSIPGLVRHHEVVVASVADPAVSALRERRGDLESTYAAAAAERTVALRAQTADALRRLGAHVLDADADTLPVELVDYYLLLKAHGRL
ncbi:DUF58 domain-containing protein [Nostocoides sp. F2B08]|uniref:DUF58 domain-containing protein n=1 Tax=Nostocoides sp. F2B08 TaxID=2653936 RepID=UPI00126362A1|nr:DUF58 domain-containing protein [Tetrasphaera sp. F2B08]KAB7741978.1 DUF58 domain-containing protein [Tetrasphaera sp. F2B08]